MSNKQMYIENFFGSRNKRRPNKIDHAETEEADNAKRKKGFLQSEIR